MLKNAYLLAKIGADTAENEQHFAEILPKTGNRHSNEARDAVAQALRHENDLVMVAAAYAAVDACNADAEKARQQNWQNFEKFWRARSRLYQNEILQENNNSKYAFDSIFQALQDLHTFAPLQSQKFHKKSV